MYSYNELNAVELSPTKKDYYQVWNELIEVAGKLSERWDPATTNESDPGVVLLKVLTAVADKLSYNIDANAMEAFMPSAAQESSMRKLCEMLGYSMRFYNSATTKARITYQGDVFPTDTGTIRIPAFTNLKDVDNLVNYLTLEDITLSASRRSQAVECIEGELVTCDTNMGQRVTLEHLDDNNRFYFPERQIAANKILVTSLAVQGAGYWEQVDNLNTCLQGSTVFKFGYDSSRGVPFIEFPEDIGNLIGTGLQIQFIRTKGSAGNISLGVLRSFDKPAIWDAVVAETADTSVASIAEGSSDGTSEDWKDPANYTVTNLSAARDGTDPETIDEAYWNYQKTIGTFDTLVTCRDYMNKIYQMTTTNTSAAPLVSNAIVSDIRDDINRAYTISTYGDQGPTYKYKSHVWKEGESLPIGVSKGDDKIHYFDLMLYPFTTINGLNTQAEYTSSFRYTDKHIADIVSRLEEQKTLAHNFIQPNLDEIVCVKVYFQLSARLNTTSKVTLLEASEIELAAHRALYRDFNLHNMSFGEELPYDSILKTLTLADARIKNVSLDDPIMYLVVCTADGKEYPITGEYVFTDAAEAYKARDFYLDLVLRNVLAGKVSLFNYEEQFKPTIDSEVCSVGSNSISSTASKLLAGETRLIIDDANEDKNKIYFKAAANALNVIAYTNTASGSFSVKLNSDSITTDPTDLPSMGNICKCVDTLTFNLYAPGSASADYMITYSHKADSNNINNLTATVYRLRDDGVYESLVAIPSGFIVNPCLESNDNTEYSAISLISIPLNNQHISNIDKISITLKRAGSDNSNANNAFNNAYLTTSWTGSWGTDTGCPNILESIKDLKEQELTYTDFIAEEPANTLDSILTLKTLNTEDPIFIRTYTKGMIPEVLNFEDYELTLGTVTNNTFDLRLKKRSSSEFFTLGAFTFTNTENKDGTTCALKFVDSDGTLYDECLLSQSNIKVTGTDINIVEPDATDAKSVYQLVFAETVEGETATTSLNFKFFKSTLGCRLEIEKVTDFAASHSIVYSRTFFEATTDPFLDIYYVKNDSSKNEYKYLKLTNENSKSIELITQLSTDPDSLFDSSTEGKELKLNMADDCISRVIVTDAVGGLLPLSTGAEPNEPTIIWKPESLSEELPVQYGTFMGEGSKPYVTLDSSNLDDLGDMKLKSVDEALPAPIKLTSDFKLDTALINKEEPLTLSANEVVQFRAPNFKTIKTYPAYVNYYLKLNSSSLGNANSGLSSSVKASPATMQTLTEFFEGGITGYAGNSKWNKEISWAEKLTSLIEAIDGSDDSSTSSGDNTGDSTGDTGTSGGTGNGESSDPNSGSGAKKESKIMAKCLTVNPIYTPKTDGQGYNANNITAGSPEESSINTTKQRYIDKYGAIFTKDLIISYNATNKKYTYTFPNGADRSVTEPSGLDVAYTVAYSDTAKGYHKYTPITGAPIPQLALLPIDYYFINITELNFGAMLQWLQGTKGNIIYREDASTIKGTAKAPQILQREKAIKSIYTRSRPNLTKPFGNGVDENHCTYSEITSLPVNIEFSEIFVPRLWSTTIEGLHSADGLGANATAKGIPANAEYELRSGEYLLINYTSSEGQEDGQAVPKNIAYGPGTIIKGNFELIDSATLINFAPYTKTADFGPWTLPNTKTVIKSSQANGEIEGLFTLAATEQIEIRERIKVELDGDVTCLYWELKNQIADSEGYEEFLYPGACYTLQPGEYLYYTDAAQEGMAYYGSGTEIVIGEYAPRIRRHSSQGKISAEQIGELGLIASIPWITVNLASTRGGITIYEYQYVNLISGDTLSEIELSDDGDSSTLLDNEFRKVETASYIAGGLEGALSRFMVSDCYWEARGRLELLLDSKNPQILQVHQTKSGAEVARDFLYVWGFKKSKTNGETKNYDLQITQVYTPILSASENGAAGSVSTTVENSLEATLGGKKVEPLAIYSSVDIIGSSGEHSFLNSTIITKAEADTEGKLTEVAFKACKPNTLMRSDGTAFVPAVDGTSLSPIVLSDPINNTGTGTGSGSGSGSSTDTKSVLTIFPIIPDNQIGLMTFYYKSLEPENADQAVVYLTPTFSPSLNASAASLEAKLAIFNYYGEGETLEVFNKPSSITVGDWKWWDNLTKPKDNTEPRTAPVTVAETEEVTATENQKIKYYLRPGINTVVIPKSCSLVISQEKILNATLAMGELKLISESNPLSPKLAFSEEGVLFRLSDQASSKLSEGNFSTLYADVDDATKAQKDAQDAFDAALKQAAPPVTTEELVPLCEALVNANNRLAAAKEALDKVLVYGFVKSKYWSLYITNNQVYKRILELDPNYEFYYTGTATGAYGLDLNELDPEDTLKVAKNWFDKQNSNNKFVVSAFDVDYLSNHVVVSKTSRSGIL